MARPPEGLVPPAFSETSGGALIRVRVTPRSSRNELADVEGDALRVKLAAPPLKGAANRALIDLLARHLGVGRRSLEIVSGERSRQKTVRIRGVSALEAARRLARSTPP